MARVRERQVHDGAVVADGAAAAPIDTLPSALLTFGSLADQLRGRTPVLCLDFDGTLSPIVSEPGDARLLDGVEAVLRALVELTPVCILSGRDAGDVCARVGLPGILYAGSHGYEVMRFDGSRQPHEEALAYLPHLEAAERHLREATAAIPGVVLDRKRFSLAIHDRLVADGDLEALYRIVARVSAEFPMLRSMRGKRVTEFLPNLDWNKGRALLWLLDMVGYDEGTQAPIAIGDDITDEDALRAVRGRGIGIVVGSGERYSAASYALRDPIEVWEFLVRLEHLLRDRPRLD